jgi:hypothetical protein
MDRTSAPNYVTNGGLRQHQDRNLSTGTPGTGLVAADRNAVQEEMMNIQAAGSAASVAAGGPPITPDASNWGQVLQALQALFAPLSGASGFSKGGSTAIALPAATAAAGVVGASGWTEDPSGLIRNWAYIQLVDPGVSSTSGTLWTFPKPFATGPLKFDALNVAVAAGQGNPAPLGIVSLVGSVTVNGATFTIHNTGTTGTLVACLLQAEGY